MGGQNVGDLLNAKASAGAGSRAASPAPTTHRAAEHRRPARCARQPQNIGGAVAARLQPASRAVPVLPLHRQPDAPAADLGRDDRPSGSGQPPVRPEGLLGRRRPRQPAAVSYLKAADYQDGHAGYSDPLDEQRSSSTRSTISQQSSSWKSTAVVILYDDSDGWYDHQMGPILTQSQTPLDALTGTGQCGANPARRPAASRPAAGSARASRCWSSRRSAEQQLRRRHVDHAGSVVQFIEDNWLAASGSAAGQRRYHRDARQHAPFRRGTGARQLFLDPSTGRAPGRGGHGHGDRGHGDYGRRHR